MNIEGKSNTDMEKNHKGSILVKLLSLGSFLVLYLIVFMLRLTIGIFNVSENSVMSPIIFVEKPLLVRILRAVYLALVVYLLKTKPCVGEIPVYMIPLSLVVIVAFLFAMSSAFESEPKKREKDAEKEDFNQYRFYRKETESSNMFFGLSITEAKKGIVSF